MKEFAAVYAFFLVSGCVTNEERMTAMARNMPPGSAVTVDRSVSGVSGGGWACGLFRCVASNGSGYGVMRRYTVVAPPKNVSYDER